MITEGLARVLTGLVEWVIGLFPTAGPPGWMRDASYYLDQALYFGAGLGAWIPWGLASSVLAAVLASVALGFTIKLVRIVASFFTAGGGSAA